MTRREMVEWRANEYARTQRRQTKKKSNVMLIFALMIGVPMLAAIAAIPYARSQGCTEMTRQWEAVRPLVTVGTLLFGAILCLSVKTGFSPVKLPGRAGRAMAFLSLLFSFLVMVVVVAGLTWIFQTLDLVNQYLKIIGC